MKAAIYVRVSTEEQAEEGFSISAQINQLESYCQRNNIQIYAPYVDEGVSAKFSDEKKRPQFEKMIRDAEKGLFNVILVHKYDRFARNVELSQKIKRQLKKANVNVISMSEPIEDSPIGFFQEGILELLAEYYIRNLAQESKKGHIERASQGLHNGSVPFGYKIDHSHPALMSVNEEQAEIVRLIFDMYVNKGYGSTKIALELQKLNLPAALCGNWSHYTVNTILKNVKYIGKIKYCDTIYNGKHDPIIDEKTFELTQRYMKDRTWKREPRGANYEKRFLLGLLRCGECNNVFSILSVNHRTRKDNTIRQYYRCNHHSHSDAVVPCSITRHLNAEKFEEYMIDYFKKYIKHIPKDIKIIQKADLAKIMQNRKGNLEQELERAKKAYLAGIFTLDEYTSVKVRCENELKEIDKPKDKDNSNIKSNIKIAMNEFEKAETPSEKRNALKKIVDTIYVYNDRIEVIFIE